jgi:hypothetical protein
MREIRLYQMDGGWCWEVIQAGRSVAHDGYYTDPADALADAQDAYDASEN